MESYGKPDIDEIVGPLRQRVGFLVSGDFSQIYNPEKNYRGFTTYTPFLNIKMYIDGFSPPEIIKMLTPILEELELFSLASISHLKDTVREFSAVSEYHLLSDEIDYYKKELSSIIDRYKYHQLGSIKQQRVLTYSQYNEPGGRTNLTNLKLGLSNYIDNISDTAFHTIFSGQHQIIDNPINWIDKEKIRLRYFISELHKHDQIGDNDRVDWEVVSNCFVFNGNKIDNSFRTNTHPPSSSFREEVSRILNNL